TMCRASVVSADWHIQICQFYAILQHFDIPFVALPRDPPISLL
ncbi:8765_t:CDS:1, partial [Funneliformis geosporum]